MSKFDFLRALTPTEYDGLKASIAAEGQLFAIVRDQNGVTLDGHHRERALRDLGVPETDWLVDTRTFEDDKARTTFVIDANHHRRQSTADDRKKLAIHLYLELGWTQATIADKLGVNQATIARDLEGLCTVHKPPSRPKGGRPKSPPGISPEKRAKIAKALSEGKTQKEAQKEAGVSNTPVRAVKNYDEGHAAALKENPVLDPASLSLSAQEKLAVLERQLRKNLAAEVEKLARIKMQHFADTFWLPEHKEKIALAEKIEAAHKGVFTSAQFKLILTCLHPDNSASIERRASAFKTFNAFERVLVRPEAPAGKYPKPPALPKTAAGWNALRD